MKYSILILLTSSLSACRQQDKEARLQNQIDSLEKQVAESYRPGFGEFMNGVQLHHGKLWYAGINGNWKLADFEIHEIAEIMEDIQKYQNDRKESPMVTMINPALDSLKVAVIKKDTSIFRRDFQFLTNTCNNCHEASKYEFIKVKIPANPNYDNNQEYKIQSPTDK